MGDRSVQRRLAAVLAADVAGYTRLMESDSSGTVAAWQDAREDVIKPRVADFSGRIVKLTGDGFLVEFRTVQDAVSCAIAMQEGLATSPLEFRMGINLGDIFDDGEDIHGEGVNVAARIEALAEPGGISISGEVHTMVRNRVTAVYENRGEFEVKNVSAPVRVYAIRPDGGQEAVVDVSAPVEGFQGRAAIAVLPFDNLSADPEQEFFADGITEDVITRLSLWQWFPVIARNSTFVFKGASIDIKEIGEKLGARYVVEGSVRKIGVRVRVTAQLIDSTTGHHLWAERYDRELEDIFAIQDEITQSIVGAIEPALGAAEQKRAQLIPPDSLDAWEASQRGFWHLYRWTREDLDLAVGWFRDAIAIDPHHPLALGGLSMTIMRQVVRHWVDDFDLAVSEMQEYGLRAIRTDDRAARGHVGLGWSRMVTGQHDSALESLERAVEVNPSFAQGYIYLALAQVFCGVGEAARTSASAAMRLSPQDPFMPWIMASKGMAYLVDRDFSAAVKHFRRAAELAPDDPIIGLNLALTLGGMGRIDEGRKHLEVVERNMPELTLEMLRVIYQG
jgi:adenylate cyclase